MCLLEKECVQSRREFFRSFRKCLYLLVQCCIQYVVLYPH